MDNRINNGIRHHYMTLSIYGDIEVTHIVKGTHLEITFEQAINGGFRELVVLDTGEIKSNTGFNGAETQILMDFMQRNIGVMWDEARGLL